MTIDRLQSKPGQFLINPEVVYGTTGSASTVASNQYPGGVQIGNIAGIAQGTASLGGGALYFNYEPKATTTGSFGQTMATGGTISHYNCQLVGLNATTTANNLQIQPPSYAGQQLTLVNCGSVSCSVATIATVNNWSTTGTVTAQVMTAAFTINAGSAVVLHANPFFVTTTGVWPVAVWHKIV